MYNLRHENDLTPSQRTSVLHYSYILLFIMAP